MILLAVCWLFLLRASLVTGDWVLCALGATGEDEDRWFVAFWSGLLTLGAAVLAVTLVGPAWYALPLLLLALLPRGGAAELRPPRWFWPVAGAMTYLASSPVRLYDTALYHQPAMEWMAWRGLVPGLALVHFRFGFTSEWLALTSMFGVGPLTDRQGVVVTGLALAVVLAHWVSLYGRNKSKETCLYLAALPLTLGFFFFDSALVSPSPNIGAALAVLVGLWVLARGGGHAAAVVLGAGALAVKLSSAPLLAVALWRARGHRKAWLGALLVLPFLAANFQTTGCPAFPVALACVDRPSSLPVEQVKAIAAETLNWARYGGAFPSGAEYFSLAWVPANLAVVRNALVAAMVAAALVALVLRRRWDAAVAAALLGTVYVYAAAPDPRFGAGFLFALPALAMPEWHWPLVARRWVTGAMVFVLTVGVFAGERISDTNNPDPRYDFSITRLLVPAVAWTPPNPPVEFEVNGAQFRRPARTDRCGALEPPCTPYAVAPELRRCGRGWCR